MGDVSNFSFLKQICEIIDFRNVLCKKRSIEGNPLHHEFGLYIARGVVRKRSPGGYNQRKLQITAGVHFEPSSVFLEG